MSWTVNLVSKLKKVFEANDNSDIEILSINDLEEWLAKHAKNLVNDFNPLLLGYTQKLKDKRWMLECFLDEWADKLKKEPNDEVLDLISNTRKILEQITFSENFVYGRALALSQVLQNDFEFLIKKIEKSKFMHDFSEFIPEKDKTLVAINPLMKEILEMEGIRKDLESEMVKFGFRKIETLTEKLHSLEIDLIKLDEIKTLLRHKFDRYKEIEGFRLEKEKEYLALKDDSRYRTIQEVDERKIEINNKLKELSENINDFFNDLREVIVQGGFESESLLKDYLKGSESIISIFKNFKFSLSLGQFELETDEAEISFFRLSNLESLKKWREKYILLKQEVKELGIDLTNHDFLTKIEDAKYRLEHFTQKSEKFKEEVYKIEFKVKSFEEKIDKDKNLINSLIKIGLNKNFQVAI